MNVWVVTTDGEQRNWQDVDVTFDAAVLQVVAGTCTTTFPLANVIAFSTSTESGTP